MQSRVDRQLRALALAKACAACGARVRTIGHLTGLPPREALRLLFPDRLAVPRGRSPDSPEWYHGANLLHRAEASIVVALYRRLRDADFPAGEALVGAYRHYVGICQPPHRISFDRAFDLAAQAAKQGHPAGLNQLGFYHRDGIGTPVNYARAAELLDEAARRGNADAVGPMRPR